METDGVSGSSHSVVSSMATIRELSVVSKKWITGGMNFSPMHRSKRMVPQESIQAESP